MKKVWLVVVAGVILVLSEGIYAQWRATAGLNASGHYLKIHAVNAIWAGVFFVIIFLLLARLGVWGIRAGWRWKRRPNSTLGLVGFQALRVASIGLATAAVAGFVFVLAIGHSVPNYAELGLGEMGHDRTPTVLYKQIRLFPWRTDKVEIQQDAIDWLEYAPGQDGIALVKTDGSRRLVFQDFDAFDQEAAEAIARKLEKPLEEVDRID